MSLPFPPPSLTAPSPPLPPFLARPPCPTPFPHLALLPWCAHVGRKQGEIEDEYDSPNPLCGIIVDFGERTAKLHVSVPS